MAISEQIREQFIIYPTEDQYYNFNSICIPSQYVLALQERRQTIRVILGQLGRLVRMSAPEINIVAEGSSPEQAWAKFLEEINKRFEPDVSAWLIFDVGPTRHEEIAEGLNAPEDEDWSEPVKSPEE
jgi:hypothetical protein